MLTVQKSYGIVQRILTRLTSLKMANLRAAPWGGQAGASPGPTSHIRTLRLAPDFCSLMLYPVCGLWNGGYVATEVLASPPTKT